jgi:hypothetical protein
MLPWDAEWVVKIDPTEIEMVFSRLRQLGVPAAYNTGLAGSCPNYHRSLFPYAVANMNIRLSSLHTDTCPCSGSVNKLTPVQST